MIVRLGSVENGNITSWKDVARSQYLITCTEIVDPDVCEDRCKSDSANRTGYPDLSHLNRITLLFTQVTPPRRDVTPGQLFNVSESKRAHAGH